MQDFTDEFDILVVTESHLDENIWNDDIQLESFATNIQRKDSSNTGGCHLTYSKDDIKIKRKSDMTSTKHRHKTVWLEVHAKGQSLFLCKTYRLHWTDIVD